MSFDIYGYYLKPGHCEVHPEIGEPYPCYVCMEEAQKDYIEYCRLLDGLATKEHALACATGIELFLTNILKGTENA